MTERALVLESFARLLDEAQLATLDALLPRRPWAESVPEELWLRHEIVDQMDERRRRALHQRLSEVLGDEAADATMSFLPPVPWGVLEDAGVGHLLR